MIGWLVVGRGLPELIVKCLPHSQIIECGCLLKLLSWESVDVCIFLTKCYALCILDRNLNIDENPLNVVKIIWQASAVYWGHKSKS